MARPHTFDCLGKKTALGGYGKVEKQVVDRIAAHKAAAAVRMEERNRKDKPDRDSSRRIDLLFNSWQTQTFALTSPLRLSTFVQSAAGSSSSSINTATTKIRKWKRWWPFHCYLPFVCLVDRKRQKKTKRKQPEKWFGWRGEKMANCVAFNGKASDDCVSKQEDLPQS